MLNLISSKVGQILNLNVIGSKFFHWTRWKHLGFWCSKWYGEVLKLSTLYLSLHKWHPHPHANKFSAFLAVRCRYLASNTLDSITSKLQWFSKKLINILTSILNLHAIFKIMYKVLLIRKFKYLLQQHRIIEQFIRNTNGELHKRKTLKVH